MPIEITIPISIFELAVAYEQPDLRILADRGVTAQALFALMAPWKPSVDDVEFLTTGKLSEQGVKIKIASQGAWFFFGAAGCRFTKDPALWAEADQILGLLGTILDGLVHITGAKLARRRSILSLHLQPKTVPFKDILRNFVAPGILKLESEATNAMATVVRWPNRRITLDGSATLANGLFVQTERDFEADASFEHVKGAILRDEVELLKLLDVVEVES